MLSSHLSIEQIHFLARNSAVFSNTQLELLLRLTIGKALMSNHENEPGHGHSVAAWAAVITAIVGVTIATLGVVLPDGTLVIVGSVLTIVSIPMGPILAKLGYGVNRESSSKK